MPKPRNPQFPALRAGWRGFALALTVGWTANPAWAAAEHTEALPNGPALRQLGPGQSLQTHPSGVPGRSLLFRLEGGVGDFGWAVVYLVDKGLFRQLGAGQDLKQVRWTRGGSEVSFVLKHAIGGTELAVDAVRYRVGGTRLFVRRLGVEALLGD